MDFQSFVDSFTVPCAVLSVQRTPDGHCGQIRIVRANDPYKDIMGPAYYDDMPYEKLVPKDVKFEDFCFRAAHMNQRMRAYVQVKAMMGWVDQIMVPMEPQNGEIGYCQFLFEVTESADPNRMAEISFDTATEVVKESIALLNADDFMQGLREVLAGILDVSEAFACRIVLIDHEQRRVTNFCEKVCGDDIPGRNLRSGDIPYEVVASWGDAIGMSNCIIVKDEHDMQRLEERNPAWVESLRDYDVTSLVLIPLKRSKTTIGYLYVVNFNVAKVVQIKELVELTTVLIGPEIANHLLLNKLAELSAMDGLTGLFNRNAMQRRMAELDDRREQNDEDATSPTSPIAPFGVVTIDLNGLKTMNDEEGHEAGDRLLMHAAEILSGVFRKSDLFRMGGDEFVVIADNIDQELFDQRVRQLEAVKEADAGLSFAIGSFWSDGSVDVHEAFRNADSRMYADKEAFYNTHPNSTKRTS